MVSLLFPNRFSTSVDAPFAPFAPRQFPDFPPNLHSIFQGAASSASSPLAASALRAPSRKGRGAAGREGARSRAMTIGINRFHLSRRGNRKIGRNGVNAPNLPIDGGGEGYRRLSIARGKDSLPSFPLEYPLLCVHCFNLIVARCGRNRGLRPVRRRSS